MEERHEMLFNLRRNRGKSLEVRYLNCLPIVGYVAYARRLMRYKPSRREFTLSAFEVAVDVMVNTCPGSLDLTMLATSKTLLARGCLYEPHGKIILRHNSNTGEELQLGREEQRLFCVLFVRPLIQFGIPLKLKARK
ncbi:hypothetical protein DPMN_152482 [Dreissena polymorpha]|uniref:Uncharacterized protein n=1 Tax=Dreissena polymorpha TaxID=45954 RepID=A0A9D4FGX0_DREPO|nr:hypothetical protein DPMN_152482 [Dreissena polymorpha]